MVLLYRMSGIQFLKIMGCARRQKNVTAHQEKKQTSRSTDNPNVGVSRQGL